MPSNAVPERTAGMMTKGPMEQRPAVHSEEGVGGCQSRWEDWQDADVEAAGAEEHAMLLAELRSLRWWQLQARLEQERMGP